MKEGTVSIIERCKKNIKTKLPFIVVEIIIIGSLSTTALMMGTTMVGITGIIVGVVFVLSILLD